MGATRDLSIAEAAVVKGSQALAEAKTCVRKLPTDLKRAERSLAQAEARLLKFQQGPRATFESALGLEFGAVAFSAEATSRVALTSVAEAQSSDTENEVTDNATNA